MPEISRPSGVRIVCPSTYEVAETQPPAPEPTKRRSGRGLPKGPIAMPSAPSEQGSDDVVSLLVGKGFELVDGIELRPAAAQPAAPSRRRAAPKAAAPQALEFSLDLKSDEDAVVLLVQDGVYTWNFPQAAAPQAPTTRRTRSKGAPAGKRATFQLEIAQARPKTAKPARRGLIGDFIFDRVKAYVLKFAAGVAVGGATKFLERNVRRGVVKMDSADLKTWTLVPDPASVKLPRNRKARVLLFIHGTFSSTVGGFGALTATKWGRDFLDQAWKTHDAVIGFDHATLSEDPLANARQLLEALTKLGTKNVTFDVVTHSRGGLVFRCLVERVLPASTWKPEFGQVVFVAAANSGTRLAEPDNWHRLIDLYTNLAVAANTAVGYLTGTKPATDLLSEIMGSLGSFVQYCATNAVTDGAIPGLAAMEPDGKFIAELNKVQPGQPKPEDCRYFAVTSDFEPRLTGNHQPREIPTRMLQWLADVVMDELMQKAPNDLVVNVSSMTAIDPGVGNFFKGTLDYPPNPEVYHTNYFLQERVVSELSKWFGFPTPAVAATLGGPRRGRKYSMTRPPQAVEPALPQSVDTAPPPRRTRGGRRGTKDVSAPQTATCHFHAEMDDQVIVKRVATVEVIVSREEIEREIGATSQGGSGEVELGKNLIVQVIPKQNFELVDEGRADMPPPEPNKPVSLYFDVRATDIGEGEIWVVVRQGQVSLTTLKLKPQVVKKKSGSVRRTKSEETSAEAKPLIEPLHQLRIFEKQNGNSVSYFYEVQSPSLEILNTYESKALASDRVQYVENLYKEIEDRWISSRADVESFTAELREFGGQLFDNLFPAELQAVLWEHRESLKSIQIISTEPFIPWELVHLKEPGKRKLPAETRFLGQMGAVRWLHGGWPPDSLKLRKDGARYVIPDYPHPDYELPETKAERSFLERTFKAKPISPHPNEVRKALSTGDFDLLHFACHGEAESDKIALAKLVLEGRVENGQYVPESLSATTVEQSSDLKSTGRRPLVVVNACQTGRAGYELTGIGGFAQAFLGAGAGAFVGCLWSVGDAPARSFTEAFYEALAARARISDAAIKAREASRQAGDATWLAYVVYGHPHATLERT